MQTGEVIRKYRKEKNLTQEEMAGRLGVTAPAISKWEKGVSQPDISLLAPIARLLGISLETLLSFQEDLTAEEIADIIEETDRKLETSSFEEVFKSASDLINKYPNCYQLIWQLAVVLDARCRTDENPDLQKYEKQIEKWYIRTLESGDSNTKKSAADSLFHYYLRNNDYEEAEKYLQYFPEESTERKIRQAQIYSKTDRRQDAYKTYEEILFSEYQMLDMVMQNLVWLSMEDNLIKQGKMWMEKDSALAALFDMGKYRMYSCRLELAVKEKDVEQTFLIVQTLLDSVETIGAFTESEMYAHMKFKQIDKGFCNRIRGELINTFRDKETYHYMEHHEGWKKLTG